MTIRFGCVAAGALFALSGTLFAHVDDPKERDRQPAYVGPGYRAADGGVAAIGFPADNVTLLAWLPVGDFGAFSSANDCWGYVSPSGNEYAIIGLSGATGFVDITTPTNPTIVAVLSGPSSTWRDIKVYQDRAYAVSEGGDGIQIFDLSDIDNGNVSFMGNVTTGGTTATHNVALNEESGYLYRCGGSDNGLRIYSLANPDTPAFVVSWSDRYVHDAHIITYDSGPYAGKEIAFCNAGLNGGGGQTGLTILDVTNKANIIEMAHYQYPAGAYSHQGWTSADRQYFYLNDELDESNFGVQTTTHVIDISDLNNPFQASTFTSGSNAIDHNLYVRDNLIFEANYRSGLRVFDATNPTAPTEIGYFDTYPQDDGASFNGMWSCFPYYPSGVVIGSDIEKGLFVWQIGQPALTYNFPDGLPETLASSNASISVVINEDQPGSLDPSTATLFYDDGNGFVGVPMSQPAGAGGNLFQAVFPSLPCGVVVEYYFSAETLDGTQIHSPISAPNDTYSALVADNQDTLFADDFEADLGWAVSNSGGLTSGAWERGVPIGGGDRGDPPTDADGSGQCYLTQNDDGDSDIDGGTTTLVSPVLNASAEQPVLSYYSWFDNSFGAAPFTDIMTVEVTDDGGFSWTLLEQIGPSGDQASGGWNFKEFDLSAIPGFNVNGAVQLRIVAGDLGEGSVVEAGFDGVSVRSISCDDAPACPGDANEDGEVGTEDLLLFLSAWGGNDPTFDFDQNGTVNAADLLTLLSNWGPCPQ